MARELDFLVNAHPTEEAARAAGRTAGAGGQGATAGGRYQPGPYVPEPKELYDTIVRMDSIYFDTYNNL